VTAPAVAYTLSPGIGWSVERTGLLVTGGEQPRFLPYPDAALWDLISRGYRYEQVVEMMCHITSLAKRDSVRLIDRLLDEWLGLGLLSMERRHG